MNAGQLRYRIILQTYSAATNANTGQSVRTWSDSETIWADEFRTWMKLGCKKRDNQ